MQYFLVSRPEACPRSTAGRTTRAYWAVKLPDPDKPDENPKVACLKDTWRIDCEGAEKEGDILVDLVEGGVCNVSDIFCQGDVPDHVEGQSSDYDEKVSGVNRK